MLGFVSLTPTYASLISCPSGRKNELDSRLRGNDEVKNSAQGKICALSAESIIQTVTHRGKPPALPGDSPRFDLYDSRKDV
ncbi:hypothetical protein AGMMS50256_17260 [Betaproteobacteria bacterium]|nr:hypothetical protein AGMMS50256_17260 [Betaproteobacteria bacterium]